MSITVFQPVDIKASVTIEASAKQTSKMTHERTDQYSRKGQFCKNIYIFIKKENVYKIFNNK